MSSQDGRYRADNRPEAPLPSEWAIDGDVVTYESHIGTTIYEPDGAGGYQMRHGGGTWPLSREDYDHYRGRARESIASRARRSAEKG